VQSSDPNELRRQRHESRASSTHKAFIRDLAKEAGVAEKEAECAAVAVLCTLERRLIDDEANDLEAQLPFKLRELLGRCERHRTGKPERFGRDEFMNRVAEHLDTSHDVEPLVRATLRTLCNHVTQGEINDVLAELPRDLRELFPRN
jgi:uncharacterized protein (DUF2267 family)